LVTSRNAAWTANITTIPLQTWPLDTAIDYLQRESGRPDLNEPNAREIAETLGALPLALAHAAAYLRGMRMVTPARYLEHINEHLKNAPRGAEYARSVFATFNTAITQAEKEAAGAAAVLCFAASFAPDAIPDELFRQPIENYAGRLQPLVPDGAALDLCSVVADDLRLDEALGVLDRLSLLAFSASSRTYSMHRLVQRASRDVVGSASRGWPECAIGVAVAAFPFPEFAMWPQCEGLLPHARAALDALPSETAFSPAGELADRCAVYLARRGDFSAAEQLHVRALAIRETGLGLEHPDVALSLNNLANVYWEQGRYDEAEQLHKRALAIREQALGPRQPDVASSLGNLANVYCLQERYDEAEPLHKRALAIWEKAFGPEHLHVAMCLNNLAAVYTEQRRFEEADPLHKRALAIREKALGPEHPEVALSLVGIADVYYEQRRYDEAEQLHKRALTIREKVLGAEHPSVARSLSDLAMVYKAQGRFEEAEPLYQRALPVLKKALGPEHLDVATALSDLAGLYNAQRRSGDAESLYIRALAIRENSLGRDNPRTKEVRDKLQALRSG
jgi:tetratricopeptide (TPR) repeat protein